MTKIKATVNTAKPISSIKLSENAINPPYYLGLETATMITIKSMIITKPPKPNNMIDIETP